MLIDHTLWTQLLLRGWKWTSSSSIVSAKTNSPAKIRKWEFQNQNVATVKVVFVLFLFFFRAYFSNWTADFQAEGLIFKLKIQVTVQISITEGTERLIFVVGPSKKPASCLQMPCLRGPLARWEPDRKPCLKLRYPHPRYCWWKVSC